MIANGGGVLSGGRFLQVPLKLPLHDAASTFQVDALTRILKHRDSNPNQVDRDGRTALHIILLDEFRGHYFQTEMEDCLQALIEDGRCNIDAMDNSGECALSLAVQHGLESAALALVKSGADTTIRTPSFPRPHSLASKIAATMPKVMMEILDSGISHNSEISKPGQITEITLDWRPILQYPAKDSHTKHNDKEMAFLYRESSFLYSLLDVPKETRREYMSHPLVSTFLLLRIKNARKKLGVIHLLMLAYPILYAVFIYHIYFSESRDKSDNGFETTGYPAIPETSLWLLSSNQSLPESREGVCITYKKEQEGEVDDVCDLLRQSRADEEGKERSCFATKNRVCELTNKIITLAILTSTVAVLMFVLDALCNAYMLLYLRDIKGLTSWRAWALRFSYLTIMITMLGPLVRRDGSNIDWLHPMAAIGITVACALVLLLVEPFILTVRLHLEMLVGVISAVVKVIILFIPLFVGFHLGMCLMFLKKIIYVMPFIQMIITDGADQYDDFWKEALSIVGSENQFFWSVANCYWVVFVVMITIIFVNFTLGVSISDIPDLKRNAEVLSWSHLVQAVFVLNLIFPFWFNLVSKLDIQRGNWTLTYQPNNKQCSARRSIPPKTRNEIIGFLKQSKEVRDGTML